MSRIRICHPALHKEANELQVFVLSVRRVRPVTRDKVYSCILHDSTAPESHQVKLRISVYLQKDVRRIVQAHDQRSASDHVVCVGEGDEQYGGQVMDQHDHEILGWEK